MSLCDKANQCTIKLTLLLLQLFDELLQVSRNSFHYTEHQDSPLDVVTELVDQLNYFEDEDCLDRGLCAMEYDEKLLVQTHNLLTTSTVNITILSTILSEKYKERFMYTEPCMRTKYNVTEIPPHWLSHEKCNAVNDQLRLPNENRYIAENFSLRAADSSSYRHPPTSIKETDRVKVWYRNDQKFHMPKSIVNFMFMGLVAQPFSHSLLCLRMLECVVSEHMEHLRCEASLADLHVEVDVTEKSFNLSFSGLNDKMFVFFKDVIERLQQFNFSQKSFQISKETLEKDYRDSLFHSSELNNIIRSSIIDNIYENPFHCLRQLKTFTSNDLHDFYRNYTSQMFVECLSQGNITREEMISFVSYLDTSFKYKVLPEANFPELTTLKLPHGRTVYRHAALGGNNTTTVVCNYYQVGPTCLRMFAVASLLKQMMEQPLHDILRVEKKVGHAVECCIEITKGGVLGFSVTAHTDSPRYSVDEIDDAIDGFLELFWENLQEDVDFEDEVERYVNLLNRTDVCLDEEVERNWSEICNGEYVFDRHHKLVDVAKSVKRSELLKFMEDFILDEDEGKVRMLSVQVIGRPLQEYCGGSGGDCGDSGGESGEYLGDDFVPLSVASHQYTQVITDIEEFKNENTFYEDSKTSF